MLYNASPQMPMSMESFSAEHFLQVWLPLEIVPFPDKDTILEPELQLWISLSDT